MEENLDNFDRVKRFFELFGYKVLSKPTLQDNDVDMYVVGNKRALRVEIKSMRISSSGNFEIAPISENQKKCDVVAVVLLNKQIFVESMEEYLIHCSSSGYRYMNYLKLD